MFLVHGRVNLNKLTSLKGMGSPVVRILAKSLWCVHWTNKFQNPGIQKVLDIVTVSSEGVFRRQGLLECLRCLKDMGMNRACISTGFSDLPARQCYQSIGFNVVYRYPDDTKPNEKLQANQAGAISLQTVANLKKRLVRVLFVQFCQSVRCRTTHQKEQSACQDDANLVYTRRNNGSG